DGEHSQTRLPPIGCLGSPETWWQRERRTGDPTAKNQPASATGPVSPTSESTQSPPRPPTGQRDSREVAVAADGVALSSLSVLSRAPPPTSIRRLRLWVCGIRGLEPRQKQSRPADTV